MSAKPVERLEKTLARVAREQGLDQERLRRWVSFLVLCGVLEQAVESGVIDTYYIKGGVAMELRFARAARTTKDFDLGLEGNRPERIRRLGEVLRLEFDAFTFRLKPEIHEMELADTVRVEVAVQYRTRAWQTIEIDLGPGEAREVDLVAPAIIGL
ncbi:MAG TPA: nucleotidyl transferase AbiEii/AbiGii toxin family protein, partial [Terriglobales bacterium]|nr:nucleotidyl transferase AbiEii/AbiGii toxin family protein [Terriglobales bacterium]